jgi:hypothetical protein
MKTRARLALTAIGEPIAFLRLEELPASFSAIWSFWQAQSYCFGFPESIRRAKRRRCAAVMSSNTAYA